MPNRSPLVVVNFTLYKGVADTWQMVDNSPESGPLLIAAGGAGKVVHVIDEGAWSRLSEGQR
jgi:hypothetical protein